MVNKETEQGENKDTAMEDLKKLIQRYFEYEGYQQYILKKLNYQFCRR